MVGNEIRNEQGRAINAPGFQLSTRLAKPLANARRNRILMAIHFLQPMSAKQLTQAFSEVNLASAARDLRELQRWGLVEIAGELRGGKRRGAIEKVYRPVQAAHFDTPTWETLPHYLRVEWSASMVEGLILRIAHAFQADTIDSEDSQHLVFRGLEFDRRSWEEYVEKLDDTLAWVNELEAESADRLMHSDDEPIPSTVALLAFRLPPPSSPAPANRKPRVPPGGETDAPHFLMSPSTAKALANPWRTFILAELHRRPMSPKQFNEELGGPDLATTARYFRQLRRWGFLEVVRELRGGKRRGSTEKVHRAIRHTYFNPAAWNALPDEVKSRGSGVVVSSLVDAIEEAVQAETFDAETDRHVSWKAVSLDRQAWSEYIAGLDGLQAWVRTLERRSTTRFAEGAQPIPAAISLMAFRSPDPY